MPQDPLEILSAESAYLSRARADLARMLENTLSLQVHSADRVSGEYLAAALWRRARSLVDDPNTTLFFGRTDHVGGECWYIGRRHVADANGDPVVIDWRAEVSRGFYRASRSEPLGLVRRRRFGIESGSITAFEDEPLSDPVGDPPSSRADDGSLQGRDVPARSAILTREIERPRLGPMRDIVATIQPEQDEIVRADLAQSVCVQGAPGTGKTAVGLHRAAWLLYAHRERLARTGVLVVGPNRSFLDHVADVLPSLGEVDVAHATALDVLAAGAGVRVMRLERDSAARLKGDARLAPVLYRAVWSQVRDPTQSLVVPRGVRRWRVDTGTAREIVAELRARGARYSAARAMLAHRLAHAVMVTMEDAGESPAERTQEALARSREMSTYVDTIWPALTPTRVLHRLYTDHEFKQHCAAGDFSPDELSLLAFDPDRPPPRTPGSARFTAADVTLLDEIADLLQRTPSLGHVVLDEAQDLSPMQLRAIGRRASTGSVTVLGDLAQGTNSWAASSWPEALAHLGQSEAVVIELDRGFRVPAAVIDWAAHLLPAIAPNLRAPSSVRDDPGSLRIVETSGPGLIDVLVAQVRASLTHEGSIGVIVADDAIAQVARALNSAGISHRNLANDDALAPPQARVETTIQPAHERVSLVPARTAKGLEFDWVVVSEPAAIAAAEPDVRTGLRRLYVVLTRAVSGLVVVHHEPLPELLSLAPAHAG